MPGVTYVHHDKKNSYTYSVLLATYRAHYFLHLDINNKLCNGLNIEIIPTDTGLGSNHLTEDPSADRGRTDKSSQIVFVSCDITNQKGALQAGGSISGCSLRRLHSQPIARPISGQILSDSLVIMRSQVSSHYSSESEMC